MTKVLHVDDNRHHFELTKAQLLRLSSDIELTNASSFEQAETALRDEAYEVVIVDDQMPRNFGIRLLTSLREAKNLTPFIVISDAELEEGQEHKLGAYHDDEFNVAINFGRFDLLNLWIHNLADKYRQYIQSQQLMTDLYRDSPHKLEELHLALDSLTKRESEILDLIAAGNSNKDIARKLGVSYRTVVNHVYNLFSKLGIHSRSEAIHIGLSRKLTENGKS